MKTINKEVIQSYIMTTAKYDFSVYEKRILYRIIETTQKLLNGKKLNKGYSIEKTLFDDRLVSIPISAILNGEEDKNHYQVRKALTSLRNKTFEYEDDKLWKLIGVIEKPKFEKYDTVATFELQAEVYDAILNFSKGFRKYELKTAMSFESTYSMRFYELFSGQKKPMTYMIETLKKMFQIENKYKQINDFTKRVIDVAKRELDKKSPYSFEYKYIKTGRKITSILFMPYDIPANKDMQLEEKKLIRQVSPAWTLSQITLDYLKNVYGFTVKEIQIHLKTLRLAEATIDLHGLLANSKRHVMDNAKEPIPYLIGMIKKTMNQKGIELQFKD